MANIIIGIFIAMVTGRLIELRYYLRIFRVLFSQFIYMLFFSVIWRASNAVCTVNL